MYDRRTGFLNVNLVEKGDEGSLESARNSLLK